MSTGESRRRSEYLTTAEVAERLRMSRKKVRDLIDREGLPAYDFGDRALRIPAGEFEEWEESRRITARRAKEEASQKA
jgi:excisionase family DNA binding protein